MSKKEKKEIRDLINSKKKENATNMSSASLNEIGTAMLNCPEYEFVDFTTSGEQSISQPIKEFRSEVAKASSRALSLDKSDTATLEENLDFTSRFTSSMLNASDAIRGEYLTTGRRMTVPIPEKDASRISIRLTDVNEKTVETVKPVKNPDGTYSRVPTGKVVTTKAHKIAAVKNATPDFLKTSKDVK